MNNQETLACGTCKQTKKQHICFCINFCQQQINDMLESQRKYIKHCSECHEICDIENDAFKSNKRLIKLIEMRDYLAKNSRKFCF